MRKYLFRDWMRWSGIFLMGILMFSCSDSEDDGKGGNGGGNGSGSQGEIVDDELMPLVGYWESSNSNARDFLFYDDGTCMSPHPSDGNQRSAGRWAYDPETRYLSNTATNQTFLITLFDDASLLGVNIANQETVAFTKNNLAGDVLYLVMSDGKWRSTENEDSLSIAYSGGIYGNKLPEKPQNTSRRRYLYANVLLSTDVEKGTYSYQLRWKGREEMYMGMGEWEWHDTYFDTNYKGSITIEDPFSPSKCRLTLTGILEGTYYKDREDTDIFD